MKTSTLSLNEYDQNLVQELCSHHENISHIEMLRYLLRKEAERLRILTPSSEVLKSVDAIVLDLRNKRATRRRRQAEAAAREPMTKQFAVPTY